MLGEAANGLPEDVADTLEGSFNPLQATASTRTADSITVLNCLRRIREVEASDGQPWPCRSYTPGQCMALARIDRANAGQTFLLELLHAIEHTRVDGDEAEQVAMARAKGCCLLFVRWPSTWMCSCARCEVSGAATRGVAPLHMR